MNPEPAPFECSIPQTEPPVTQTAAAIPSCAECGQPLRLEPYRGCWLLTCPADARHAGRRAAA